MSDATVAAENSAKKQPPVSPPAIDAIVERKIDPQREATFQEHGWKQMEYDAIAAVGTSTDDVMKREYWAHVAARCLRHMTKIYIMAEDRSWYGELIVWDTTPSGAIVSWIHPPVHFSRTQIVREENEYESFDGGMEKNWCVRRRKDGRVISDRHSTKAEADLWLSNWLKAQGGGRRAA